MTTSRRVLKAAEAVREVVSMAILTELRDPRVRDVTVTFVEVSPDMRHAKVHVSIMGDDTKQQLSLRGLESAAGFLQQKINDRIDTRYTPKLKFVLDQGVKRSLEVARILGQVLPPEPPDPKLMKEPSDGEMPPDDVPPPDELPPPDETAAAEQSADEMSDDDSS